MAGLDDLIQLLTGGVPMGVGGPTPDMNAQGLLSDPAMLAKLIGGGAQPAGAGISSPGVPRINGAMPPTPTPRPRITNNTATDDTGAEASPDATPRLFGDKLMTAADDIAAGVSPNPASPLASFASGFSGAGASAKARTAAERKTRLENEDRALKLDDRTYQRGRDKVADRRADAAAGRAGAAASRAERTAALNGLLTQARIDEIHRKGGLGKMTGKDLLNIEKLAVRDYASSLGLGANGTLNPRQRTDALAKVELYKADLQERYRAVLADGGAGDSGVDDTSADDTSDGGGVDLSGYGGDTGDTAPAPAVAAPAPAAPRIATPAAPAAPALKPTDMGYSPSNPIKVPSGDRAAFLRVPKDGYIQDESGRIFKKKN